MARCAIDSAKLHQSKLDTDVLSRDYACLFMDEAQPPAVTTPALARTGRAEPSNPPQFWRRPLVIVSVSVILALALFFALGYLVESFTHEVTDDAFLDSDVVSIAPQVAGRVKQVCVSNNQQVAAGDLLVEIDSRDYEVQAQQKQAAVKSAEANVALLRSSLDLFRAQIATAQATAKQSDAEAEAAKANTEKAEADFKRAQDLISNRTISPQEFDSARAAATSAEANLKSAQEKAVGDESKVAQMRAQLEAGIKAYERGEAQTREAEMETKTADLNVSYTRLTAPRAGYVTRKAVEPGDYLQVGQRLMALVPAQGLYVTANFKETQLQNIRPGQPVEVTIDSVEHGPFTGRVESIQAGSGARFSLLPPENAVGNFVKVVQRVPVKIVFDRLPQSDHVLGPGMSVVPKVRVAAFNPPAWLVGLTAIIIAAVVGGFWMRMAGRNPDVA
jgi:membrane fusion protein (multidrug efflux system)